ncbi:MAG: hypothetical protein GY738_21855 [Pseudoalteromonas sp.]|nr:hypothetical protein [Pseudoalteromonas sp.]
MNNRNFGYKDIKRQAEELQGKKMTVSQHFGCAVVEGLMIAAACTGLICAGIWLAK